MDESKESMNLVAVFALSSLVICQKMQMCCKNAYDGLENVLLVIIYVTEMYANCVSRNANCSIYKVEIISLAFKWLIILRSAIKMHLLCPKTCKQRTFTCLPHRLL